MVSRAENHVLVRDILLHIFGSNYTWPKTIFWIVNKSDRGMLTEIIKDKNKISRVVNDILFIFWKVFWNFFILPSISENKNVTGSMGIRIIPLFCEFRKAESDDQKLKEALCYESGCYLCGRFSVENHGKIRNISPS